jgi:hypothetical protein
MKLPTVLLSAFLLCSHVSAKHGQVDRDLRRHLVMVFMDKEEATNSMAFAKRSSLNLEHVLLGTMDKVVLSVTFVGKEAGPCPVSV